MTTFATCSYQEFDPSYGIPVKSTLGHPRFKLRYDLAANWREAAPEKAWFDASKTEFRDRYFEKLDKTGVVGFRSMAWDIRKTVTGETPIVLLCFDKLWIPESWCHRTMFATWFEERTGESVPELGKVLHDVKL